MNKINRRFSSKFRSHWIKVKFYREKPDLKDAQRIENIRFCEATKKALIQPILLDKESISCMHAQYVFGWRPPFKNELLDSCRNKRKIQRNVLESMLSQTPRFEEPFKYIGLNVEGEPDLVMSYMSPQEVMNLINIHHNYHGKNLDVSLCGMMSICGGIAVRTFRDENISFSFGCDDSRKYADIGRDRLAVGVPNKLFKVFVD